jgi:hypothetical protein
MSVQMTGGGRHIVTGPLRTDLRPDLDWLEEALGLGQSRGRQPKEDGGSGGGERGGGREGGGRAAGGPPKVVVLVSGGAAGAAGCRLRAARPDRALMAACDTATTVERCGARLRCIPSKIT